MGAHFEALDKSVLTAPPVLLSIFFHPNLVIGTMWEVTPEGTVHCVRFTTYHLSKKKTPLRPYTRAGQFKKIPAKISGSIVAI